MLLKNKNKNKNKNKSVRVRVKVGVSEIILKNYSATCYMYTIFSIRIMHLSCIFSICNN